jgi:hypothetical protein
MKYEIVQPIKLIEYSEKCLAVVGETKQFKEALKEMGGRYNPALSCGPAWIFPVKKREEVQKFVNSKGGDGRFKQLLLF